METIFSCLEQSFVCSLYKIKPMSTSISTCQVDQKSEDQKSLKQNESIFYKIIISKWYVKEEDGFEENNSSRCCL